MTKKSEKKSAEKTEKVEKTTVEQPTVEQPTVEQPEADQPEAEQPEAEQPATEQPEAEQPTDNAPADGKGCEAVTVVIVATDENRGAIIGNSVQKNLVGVDADIHLVTGEHLRDTLQETLLEHLSHIKTERIILVTDGMLFLNPVTLGDVAVIKALEIGDALNYNTKLPVLMHKSVLESLLKEAKTSGLDHIDVVDAYFKGTVPEGFRPLLLGKWETDPWLLPVISENPSVEAISKYAQWKKFAHIGPNSWSDDVLNFFVERFG